jgi:hypothetical protein
MSLLVPADQEDGGMLSHLLQFLAINKESSGSQCIPYMPSTEQRHAPVSPHKSTAPLWYVCHAGMHVVSRERRAVAWG